VIAAEPSPPLPRLDYQPQRLGFIDFDALQLSNRPVILDVLPESPTHRAIVSALRVIE
jgi:hypothetical protein